MPVGLDIERDQLGIEPVGGALGGAHGVGGGRARIDADDHALAGRPRAGDGMLAHVAQHLAGGGADKDLQPAGLIVLPAGRLPAAHPARAAVQGRDLP